MAKFDADIRVIVRVSFEFDPRPDVGKYVEDVVMPEICDKIDAMPGLVKTLRDRTLIEEVLPE